MRKPLIALIITGLTIIHILIGVDITKRNLKEPIKNNFEDRVLNSPGNITYEVEDSGTPKFHRVTRDVWGYSAFFIPRYILGPTAKIRILGLVYHVDLGNEKMNCLYYTSNGILWDKKVAAKKDSKSRHDWNSPFIVFYQCDWEEIRQGPTHVALVKEGQYDGAKLPVSYPGYPEFDKYKVAVCYKQFFEGYENPLQLLEWIEYHLHIGVQHFTFYNRSTGPKTLELLRTYENQGIATIHNFPVPIMTKNMGEQVAHTDCSLRYRRVAKYVITMDPDEFLVLPKNYSNLYPWFEDIWFREESLERSNTSEIAYMEFPWKLSFTEWPRDEDRVRKLLGPKDKPLRRLNLPFRTGVIPAAQYKSVMRPELVLESGIHHPYHIKEGSYWERLDHSEGYILHFTDCDGFANPSCALKGGLTCNSSKAIQQDSYAADRFGAILIDRVKKRVKNTPGLRKVFSGM